MTGMSPPLALRRPFPWSCMMFMLCALARSAAMSIFVHPVSGRHRNENCFPGAPPLVVGMMSHVIRGVAPEQIVVTTLLQVACCVGVSGATAVVLHVNGVGGGAGLGSSTLFTFSSSLVGGSHTES